ELAGQFGRVHHIAKHDGELAAFGMRGRGCRRWRGRLGQRHLLRYRLGGRWQRGWGHGRLTRPDQDIAPLIDRQALTRDEFVLQIFQICVIELELALKGAIGQAPTALEHGDRLVEDLLKGHRPPSLYRGGMQQTVWELAKPFGRMYTA